MSRRTWLAIVMAGALLPGMAYAQTPLPAAQAPLGALSVGNALVLPESRIQLNRIIRPDDPISISPLTEYNYTLTNTTTDQEVTIQAGGITVGGEVRRPAGTAQEILEMNAGSGAAKAAGATAVGGALGLLGAFLGPVALIAANVGVSSAVAHTMYDTPVARMNELKKRLFPNAQGDSVVLLPGESATGSIWIRQSKDEPATLVQLFVKPGAGSRRLVQLRLADAPPSPIAKPEAEPKVTLTTAEPLSKQ